MTFPAKLHVALVVVDRVAHQVVVAGELDGAGRLTVQRVVDRVAPLEGGEQSEDLETGSIPSTGDERERGVRGGSEAGQRH